MNPVPITRGQFLCSALGGFAGARPQSYGRFGSSAVPRGREGPGASRWFKGGLHVHTRNSDGDSTPRDVAAWHKANGYQFIAVTDHNAVTPVEELNAVFGADGTFLSIAGEEFTSGCGGKPVHLNAYNIPSAVSPKAGGSVAETIRNNEAAIRSAGGVACLNHPNFGWGVTSADLLACPDLRLFEVYNGHPGVNNRGGGGLEPVEEMWDVALSAGRLLYGVAVDDAHSFRSFSRYAACPGRGWVMVRAPELTPEALTEALLGGDFYASTGVVLTNVQVSPDAYRVWIRPAAGTRQTTYFIGEGGRILAKSYEDAAAYKFDGSEGYVRARVECSNGDNAWTQPVFL